MSLVIRINALAVRAAQEIKALNEGKASIAHTHVSDNITDAVMPTQPQAEAGTDTTARFWSAVRVKQAILALSPVLSVAGKTGVVALVKGDVGLGNVDNTSDNGKPISAVAQIALDAKSGVGHSHSDKADVGHTHDMLDFENDVWLRPMAKAVALTNVSITDNALPVLDGLTCAAGDRVLLTAQTSPSQNGLWIVLNSGTWVRPVAENQDNWLNGRIVTIQQGTDYIGSMWLIQMAGTNLGTDPVSVTRVLTSADAAQLGGITGEIKMWPTATAPDGWFLCNGSVTPSRTIYNALYTALGGGSSPWGQGDGSSTFNLPDFRGRFPIGVGTGTGLTARALNAPGGAEKIANANLPAHQHTMAHTHEVQRRAAVGAGTGTAQGGGAVSPDGTVTSGASSATQTGTGDSGGAFGNTAFMNPFLGINFIIKY